MEKPLLPATRFKLGVVVTTAIVAGLYGLHRWAELAWEVTAVIGSIIFACLVFMGVAYDVYERNLVDDGADDDLNVPVFDNWGQFNSLMQALESDEDKKQ